MKKAATARTAMTMMTGRDRVPVRMRVGCWFVGGEASCLGSRVDNILGRNMVCRVGRRMCAYTLLLFYREDKGLAGWTLVHGARCPWLVMSSLRVFFLVGDCCNLVSLGVVTNETRASSRPDRRNMK